MTIKSLLIGSFAAMAAVTGAGAADAVVAAEPEAVEYVRVCDAYGAGYFYIPGTETCLKIGGYVRYDIGGGDLFAVTSNTGEQTYFKQARLSLQLSTGSETELGTLTTFVETRTQWNTSAADVGYTNDNEFSLNFAYIELGGLRIGKDESFFTTFPGYAGNVLNDTILEDAGGFGGYGPFDTNLISYSYSNNGFSFGISLEQGDDSFVEAGDDGVFGTVDDFPGGWGIDDYMPHVVAGAGYQTDLFQIRAVLGYDTRDDISLPLAGTFEQGGWAAKLRGDLTLGERVSMFAMLMYGENASAYTAWSNGVVGGKTFSVLGGASFQASEKLALNAQLQWTDGGAIDDNWAAVANAAYTIVPDLTITPEAAYVDTGDEDYFGGYVRFERSF